jgi:hypothetical protein
MTIHAQLGCNHISYYYFSSQEFILVSCCGGNIGFTINTQKNIFCRNICGKFQPSLLSKERITFTYFPKWSYFKLCLVVAAILDL